MDNLRELLVQRQLEIMRVLSILGQLYNCQEIGSLTRELIRQEYDGLVNEYGRLQNMLDGHIDQGEYNA